MKQAYDSALRSRIVEHLAAAVELTPLEMEPFPHILAEEFLPDDVYWRLLASLPPLKLYEPFQYEKNHQKDGKSNRHRFQMGNDWLDRLPGELRTFWYTVRSALGSEDLKLAVFEKLSPGLALRYGIEPSAAKALPGFALPELFHETEGYSIKPHPDTRKKVVTMQVSLAADASQRDLGTEFYRRSINPVAWMREPRGFEVVKRMPFLPNAAYAFSVLNTFKLKSWHGRTAIPGQFGERNSLLNIWYEKRENSNVDLAAERPAASRMRAA